jgi:hypothetical protein
MGLSSIILNVASRVRKVVPSVHTHTHSVTVQVKNVMQHSRSQKIERAVDIIKFNYRRITWKMFSFSY